jgi:hypothetical protein
MPRFTIRVLVAVLLAFAAACDTPVAPDRGPKDTNGTPTHLGFRSWRQDVATQTALVQAWGTWGVLYTLSSDVSIDAVWTSSRPSVARIVAPGRIQSVGEGETTLTVTFRQLTISQRFRVFPGAPPIRITSVSAAKVRDASVQSGEDGLPGVTVEILTGYNAGRSTVTVARGQFGFDGDFYCGDALMRLTKAGYREVVRTYSWCSGEPQEGFSMTPG